jgi:hypothetical protein
MHNTGHFKLLINFWHVIWFNEYGKLDENINPSFSEIMRTKILALAFTFTSLGAIETTANPNIIGMNKLTTKVSITYSSRMYAKRTIRNAKMSITRAKRVVNNWSPFRADLAEAIRHQQYAIDLFYWGDYYEAARNSDYAGRIAEYVLFQAYDNGYCSQNDYYNGNNNSGWFWGGDNGWGFGYNQNNNGYNNNGYGNGNNGWNNGGNDDDYDLNKKGKKGNGFKGPRNQGSIEGGNNNPNSNNSGNPRFDGGLNKPNFEQNGNTNPRNNKPSFEAPKISNPRNNNFEEEQGKTKASKQSEVSKEQPKIDDAQRKEMKSAFDKMKLDKPDDSKMKMKAKTDDEVLKSEEKLDIDL